MSTEKFLSRYPTLVRGFSDMVAMDKKLDDYEYARKEELVYSILMLMGRQIGGISFFYRDGKEQDIVSGWIDGLGKIKPRTIFEAVEAILDGLYERKGEIVPRSVMDFKWFIRQRGENVAPYYQKADLGALRIEFDAQGARQRKETTAKENFNKMYLLLQKTYSKVQVHQSTRGRPIVR